MKFTINRIIRYLILSDLIFYTGWGLINPVFAIFIVEKITGGSPLIVGIATAIYWLLMSILRIPISIYLDHHQGERDDYFCTVLGLLIAALVPFGYLFITLPWQLYFLQAIYAIGMSLSLSGWSAIFTRNIDPGQEATEWSLNATGYGLGTGVAGVIGGYAVTQLGFHPVFIGVGILGLMGVLLLLVIRKDIPATPPDHRYYFSFRDTFRK